MIELTEQQHPVMKATPSEPIRAIDPANNAEYVLLRAEVYDRLKVTLSLEPTWTDDTYAAAMETFARDGWDDPRMDVYDSIRAAEEP